MKLVTERQSWLPPQRARLTTVAVAGLALALLIAYAIARWTASSQAPPQAGLYRGTELAAQPAPDFRLLDHRGQSVGLSDYRGRVVVLTFLDSQCTDICPLIGLALQRVHEQLAKEAPGYQGEVVFLGVNTSHDALRPEDVAAATARFGLDRLTTWHFLTGGLEELHAVTTAYGVSPSPAGHVEHTTATYVLDRRGQLRWLSTETWPGPLSETLVEQVRRVLREQ